MNTKQRIAQFLRIMDEIQRLASKAERIGWDEIHDNKADTSGNSEEGWAMQRIGDHINWWFSNPREYTEEWEILEKEGE